MKETDYEKHIKESAGLHSRHSSASFHATLTAVSQAEESLYPVRLISTEHSVSSSEQLYLRMLQLFLILTILYQQSFTTRRLRISSTIH